MARFFTLSMLVMLTLILPLNFACNIDNPSLYIQVENQTSQKIIMQRGGRTIFSAEPHKNTRGLAGPAIGPIFIDALDDNGEVIYARYFQYREFKGFFDTFSLKITISEKEEEPYLPLEIENGLYNSIDVGVSGESIFGSVAPGATLRTRPLPPDQNTYEIYAFEDIPGGGAKYVFSKTYTKSELESQNWKIKIDATSIFH